MPNRPRPVTEILFPAGGLVRNVGYQHQPPYTTCYCVNVRPFDVEQTRQRGGARRGLVKTYGQRMGGGGDHLVQMLNVATRVGDDGVATNLLVAICNGSFYHNDSGNFTAIGGTLNELATQMQGTQVGLKFYIAQYRTPNIMGINGTIANGNQLSEIDWTAVTPPIDLIEDLVWIYGSVDAESNIFPITAVHAGYLEFGGTMTNQSGEVTWQIGRPGRVFDPVVPNASLTPLMDSYPIPPSYYNTGTVTIISGVITLTGGSWGAVPQATDTTMTTIEIPASSGIGTEQYRVANTTLTASGGTLNDTTTNADRTDVPYTLSWASKYYGIPPLNCPLCCTYRGRLVLAGPGSVWYMSRVLDPNDWDYGYDPNDASRAVAGTSSTAGGIPEPITALIPHSDDYLLFGCERSIWRLSGDAAYSGTLHALSRDIGVLGPNAWCSMPDGSTMILSRDGLYLIPPGTGTPQSVSRPHLPQELLDVNYQDNLVSLCYDIQQRGIHISVTPVAGTAGVHFFFDWVNKTFWPDTYPDMMQFTTMVRYSSGATALSPVVMGGLDGYVRQYSDNATDDDGTAFDAAVGFGPVRIGGPGYEGVLMNMAADMGANSTSAAWGLYVADTAETITAAMIAGSPYFLTGTFTAGFNHPSWPRARGGAIGLVVTGTAGLAMEDIRITTRKGGNLR